MRVAIPQSEILIKLQHLGWTVKKIDFRNGNYVARAESELTGQDVERLGKTPEMAVASVYQYAAQANQVRRFAALKKIGAWDTDWLSEKEEIAKAYSQMPPYDQKAVPAWQALAAESKLQADAIRQQIRVEVVDDPEPYASAAEMCEDIHKNKNFKVSRANSEHPVWTLEDNINFRIVHDVLGHCQSGGDFSWRGENLACGVHFPLVSPLAREALFTECIGLVAYRSHFKGFGPQKIGLLSHFLQPVQEKNGEHIWVPHGGLPELAQSPNQNMGGSALDQAAGLNGVFNSPGDWMPAHGDQSQLAPPSPSFEWKPPVMQGFKSVTKSVSPNRPHDPNQFWTPEAAPPLSDPSQDYIGIGDTVSNAMKINTDWWNEDEATQKKAIMNAFRVALLSPRKHLKWNAAHYQALMNTDPATKAVDLWHVLEQAREQHNQRLGHPEGSHLAYRKQLEYLAHRLQEENEWVSHADALKEAKKIIFEKTKEFETQLGDDPSLQEKSELRRYNMARALTTQWMRDNYSPAKGWTPGQLQLAKEAGLEEFHEDAGQLHKDADEWMRDIMLVLPEEEWPQWVKNRARAQMGDGMKPVDWTPYPDPQDTAPGETSFPEDWTRLGVQLFDPGESWEPMQDSSGFASDDAKYGAFMGAHLDGIEQVGQHIDQIREAALRDLNEGGKGFVFRNTVMNMNLPGVNPKVASFAWLLLAPTSSELGVIDTHVLRGLRRNDTDMSPRDYYKFERMQRAAKDASGYSHTPLGLYHWGLWDQIRNPGEHSDHSPLRVLDPLPWDSPDAKWDAAYNARAGHWVGPEGFEKARPHMERAARDFDAEMMSQPSGLVPLVTAPYQVPRV